MAIKASASITLSCVVDVSSSTRYYKLQASTLAKPTKPTSKPPSGWITTEPTYTAGSTNSLYLTDLTVFSDGTFAYSDVSLSSSYEAAKAAYNKAVEAAKTASNYISHSSKGLVVGNMTDNVLGNNVLIDSDSVDIRNGETVLSSFGANSIELGKSSKAAKISMSGGMFEVYSDQESGKTLLTSPQAISMFRGQKGTPTNPRYVTSNVSVDASEEVAAASASISASGYNQAGQTHAAVNLKANSSGGEIRMYADGIYINNTELGDFVVVQGISGGWKYRKWNSGIAECWKTLTHNINSFDWWNQGSYVYCGTNDVPPQAYPFPFIEEPTVVASVRGITYAMNSFTPFFGPESDTASRMTYAPQMWVVCPTFGNGGNVEAKYYAHGRYK